MEQIKTCAGFKLISVPYEFRFHRSLIEFNMYRVQAIAKYYP